MRYVLVVALLVFAGACTSVQGETSSTTTEPSVVPEPDAAVTSSTSIASATSSTVSEPGDVFVLVDDVEIPDESTVEIGSGSCLPEAAFVGHAVDCVFPLVGSGREIAALAGRAVAYVSTGSRGASDAAHPGWMSSSSKSWLCRVTDGALECPRMTLYDAVDSQTSLSVSVDVGDVTFEDVAVVEALPESDSPVLMRGPGWTDPDWAGMFAGIPQRLQIERSSTAQEPIWGLLQSWPDKAVVGSMQLLDATEVSSRPVLRVDDPGEYALVACVGADLATCEESPSGLRLNVIDPLLQPLVAGHNGQDRIDVIVTGYGFAAHEELVTAARTLLDPDGRPIVVESTGDRELFMPVFAVEPLRSNTDRFNLWILPQPFGVTPFLRCGLSVDDLECPEGLDEEYLDVSVLGVDDPTFVELGAMPLGYIDIPETSEGAAWIAYSTEDPGWVSGQPTRPVDKDGWSLGAYASVGVEALRPWTSDLITLHEIGHSWFGLHEEYGGPDELNEEASDDATLVAPNCASSADDATAQWGDLIGKTDPFADEYLSLLELAGIDSPSDPVHLVTTGIHPGGHCGVKPSLSSIMEGDTAAVPVFGSVNRQWAEQILDLWN